MVKKDRGFQICANIFMLLLCACCIVPFLLLIISSLTDENTLVRNGYSFFPEQWSLYAYEYMFLRSRSIIRGYLITIGVTLVGTVCNLTLTTLMAYPLSRRDLPHRNKIGFFVYFTMLFNGGVVPSYIMWTQVFHIKNTYLALIIPNLMMSAFYIMMMRTYFAANIPDAVVEAARIDGAGELRTLIQVVLPMSLPIIASLTLLVGLKYWNDWINGLYYITKPEYFSIQVLLNRMLKDSQAMMEFTANPDQIFPSTSYKMAIAVAGALPVLAVYPFFQRYFVKGIAIGAVKG